MINEAAKLIADQGHKEAGLYFDNDKAGQQGIAKFEAVFRDKYGDADLIFSSS